MHIAASRPECVSEEQLSNELLEREKAIFIEQAKESGKPDNIIEKMIVGRMKKFVNEVTLYGQAFIKDPETSVGELVKSKNAEVVSFVRFEVGEGIEKKEDNFVEEVMASGSGLIYSFVFKKGRTRRLFYCLLWLFQIHYISDLSLIISFMMAGIKKKSAKRATKIALAVNTPKSNMLFI